MTLPPSTSAEQRYRTLQLICWSFLFSLVVYVFVARTVAANMTGMEGIPQQVHWVLLAMAAVALVAASFVAGRILARAKQTEDADARFAAYQQAVIVAFAMRESAGVFGIVITFLTGNWLWCLGLSAAAALAMIAAWPTRTAVDRFVDPSAPHPIA